MEEEIYLIYGQLMASQSLEALALLFPKMKTKLGESSHYEGGRYLRITDVAETELTFEKIQRKEFLIKGEADTKEALQNLCKRISAILTANQLKHRMELYDEAEVQFHFLHFNWENT
ncbi:MAG: hypothetical protein V4714_14080 [Bacteroidota bacterium]